MNVMNVRRSYLHLDWKKKTDWLGLVQQKETTFKDDFHSVRTSREQTGQFVDRMTSLDGWPYVTRIPSEWKITCISVCATWKNL